MDCESKTIFGGAACTDRRSVIITNIIRMISVYPPNGAPCQSPTFHVKLIRVNIYSVSVLRDELWINLHVGSAIWCACLPTYRPLIARAVEATSSFRNRYSSKMGSTKASAMNDSPYNSQVDSRSRRPNYAKLGGSANEAVKLSDVRATKHGSPLPNNVIEVKKTVEVV